MGASRTTPRLTIPWEDRQDSACSCTQGGAWLQREDAEQSQPRDRHGGWGRRKPADTQDVLHASSTRGETQGRHGAPVFIGAGHMGALCRHRRKFYTPRRKAGVKRKPCCLQSVGMAAGPSRESREPPGIQVCRLQGK